MAQKRRKEHPMKRRERRLTALCIGGGIGAVLLSLFVCMMIFDIRPDETPVSAPVTTALPYDSTQPFSAGDRTSAQMNDLRANGRISVSDGPRGVSIGDSPETTGDLTGEQSNEEMILYCAQYFENQNGVMTALPPRGLLTVDSGSIIVTLMAPTSAYPAGTLEQYSRYEHVYCIYTVSPDTMTVQSIVLGLSR